MRVVQKELPENILYRFRRRRRAITIRSRSFGSTIRCLPRNLRAFHGQHNGIFFDVLAHDQTGNHRWSQKLHLMLTMLSRSIVFNKWGNTDIKSGGNHPVICRIVDHVKYLIPMPFAEWAQKKALTFFQNRNTNYLYDGMGRNLKRGAFPKSWLMETVYVDFEGTNSRFRRSMISI